MFSYKRSSYVYILVYKFLTTYFIIKKALLKCYAVYIDSLISFSISYSDFRSIDAISLIGVLELFSRISKSSLIKIFPPQNFFVNIPQNIFFLQHLQNTEKNFRQNFIIRPSLFFFKILKIFF